MLEQDGAIVHQPSIDNAALIVGDNVDREMGRVIRIGLAGEDDEILLPIRERKRPDVLHDFAGILPEGRHVDHPRQQEKGRLLIAEVENVNDDQNAFSTGAGAGVQECGAAGAEGSKVIGDASDKLIPDIWNHVEKGAWGAVDEDLRVLDTRIAARDGWI